MLSVVSRSRATPDHAGLAVPGTTSSTRTEDICASLFRDGDLNAKLLRVGVLVREIQDTNKLLLRILAFIDKVGTAVDPWRHFSEKCQARLTHFALVLQFEDDDERSWIIDRNVSGINVFCKDEQEVRWIRGSMVQYEDNQPSSLLCDVSEYGQEFGRVTRAIVCQFMKEQTRKKYNVFGKNCQDLCLSFYKRSIHHRDFSQTRDLTFKDYMQLTFVRHRRKIGCSKLVERE